MITLRQTYKAHTANRVHIVWEDVKSKASFVYVGEKLSAAQAKALLLRLIKTEPFTPGEVHWVWKQLEAL